MDPVGSRYGSAANCSTSGSQSPVKFVTVNVRLCGPRVGFCLSDVNNAIYAILYDLSGSFTVSMSELQSCCQSVTLLRRSMTQSHSMSLGSLSQSLSRF